MSLTLKELLDWVSEIGNLAKATRAAAKNHTNSAEFFGGLSRVSTWEGSGGDAARVSMAMTAAQHEEAADNLVLGGLGMEHTHQEAEVLANKIKAMLNYAADEQPAVEVNCSTNEVISPNTDYLYDDAAAKVQQKVTELQKQVAALLAEGDQVDADLARAIAVATGLPEPEVNHGTLADDHSKTDPERTRNQEQAFEKVYGHKPVTANDWRMAAALDPHSYGPNYHGAPPEIVAGRITPQPGKGVVRSNIFIPTDQVKNVAKDPTDVAQGRYFPMNLGDNRGPSATADPEASRVSVFVDYDHGIVVVRQNPTVNADGQRGGAAAAVPDVHVVQAPDGRVTVDYNAHDAYENPVGTAMGISVNGRITFAPHSDGTVGLGGNTTIYPSMETYQYRDGAAPTQLQWTPANSGSEYGPGTSLSRHHWVGDTGIAPVRPDMPSWKWELENAIPFVHDPLLEHTTQLTDPFKGSVPAVGIGR